MNIETDKSQKLCCLFNVVTNDFELIGRPWWAYKKACKINVQVQPIIRFY